MQFVIRIIRHRNTGEFVDESRKNVTGALVGGDNYASRAFTDAEFTGSSSLKSGALKVVMTFTSSHGPMFTTPPIEYAFDRPGVLSLKWFLGEITPTIEKLAD